MLFARTLIPALALSLAFTLSAAQPEKAVTPVPVAKEFLDGTRLVLKSAGCSIDLPGPGWAWMTADKTAQNFLCVNTKTFDIYVVGVGKLEHDMVDHQPQSLIASAKKTLESRGGKIENDKYEFIDTPGAKKSARISIDEIDKSGKKLACIYLVNTSGLALLKIHCTVAAASEPEAFRKMVKSLKVTASPEK